jgi:hypothetical protein
LALLAADPERLFEIGVVGHERAKELQLPPFALASFHRGGVGGILGKNAQSSN